MPPDERSPDLRWCSASAATSRAVLSLWCGVCLSKGKEVPSLKLSTRNLTIMALLIALSIVLTRFASLRVAIGGVEGIRIGFGSLPIILGAVMFGPAGGGIIGALADVIGYPFMAIGPYVPHFTITSALTGIIPGLVLSARRSRGVPSLPELILAIGIGQVITSVLLVPYLIFRLFGLPISIQLPPRIVSQALQIPVYAMFCRTLLARLGAAVGPLRHAATE